MRTKRLIIWLWTVLIPMVGMAQGIPMIMNFPSEKYGAHNRNFDILTRDDGTVYVANFEGLLYYDNAEWHVLHTPKIASLTTLYMDHRGVIWTGGYNYIGRLLTKDDGQLFLQPLGEKEFFSGEVLKIWESDGVVHFLVNDGMVYQVEGETVKPLQRVSETVLSAGLTDAVEVVGSKGHYEVNILSDIIQKESLGDGLVVEVRKGNGLVVTHEASGKRYSVTERNGLCSDNVTKVVYNGHGLLWGATDYGLFCMSVPSAYTEFTVQEGLEGEVLSIADFNGRKYIGTTEGLFRLEDNRTFSRLFDQNYACWQLLSDKGRLLIATDNGLYSLSEGGRLSQLTFSSCTAIFSDGEDLYTGETDGVYMGEPGKKVRRVSTLPFVDKIYKDGDGSIWIQNIYGKIFRKPAAGNEFVSWTKDQETSTSFTLVKVDGRVKTFTAETEEPFPYPFFSFADDGGITWLTDSEGKNLYCWKDGKRQDEWVRLLSPIRDKVVRSIYHQGDELWVGGQYGITVIDSKKHDAALSAQPRLRFRSARLGRDRVLWGGFTESRTLRLKSSERDLTFTYGIDHPALIGNTLYRYKLDNEAWSAWTTDQALRFNGFQYGTHTLSVQAMLASGELSNIAQMKFSIAYPFYMRWYMWVLYALLLIQITYAFFRLRLYRLKKEKQKLEQTVQERTAEIREKSTRLEKALTDLKNTQNELIRSEKMATIGKLTQGLVDRILNPMNYINNYSKLSIGLADDIRQNMEDAKDALDAEMYDDTADLLDMLCENMDSVNRHGQNATRVLQAMGDLLQDRTGGAEPMDLIPVLRQCEATLHQEYAKEIEGHAISTVFDLPQTPLMIMGNGQSLGRAFGSLLDNSIFAISKKASRQAYEASLSLAVTVTGGNAVVTVRDNGIGIEAPVINKVFDPFFTTKPTSEATGIGLYICREIIQNHHGSISISSEKGEYTEVIVTLPLLKD